MPESMLAKNQMVIFYGAPQSAGLGILGAFSPEEAGARLTQEAQYYDSLNGDRGAIGAMDLIYGQVQAEPTENGLYMRYASADTVGRYLAVAEASDLQLILDLQIGRSNILDEVKKIEPWLRNPRVQVAIDPEYAVGPDGIPLETPGRISGDEINAVQSYISDLVQKYSLPPKLLFIHQYLDDTIVDGQKVSTEFQNVDIVLNMDAFGDAAEKYRKYQGFASRPYAEHLGFNVFLAYDDQPLSEQQVLELSPPPDVVFYQ